MNIKQSLTKGYQGYLNPKRRLPRECVLFFLVSVFTGSLVATVMGLMGLDHWLASWSAGAVSTVIFVGLFAVNNRVFKTDASLLEDMIVQQKIDAIDLLYQFFLELQEALSRAGAFYPGVTLPETDQTEVVGLFEKVFREDGMMVYSRFQACEGNFIAFVYALDVRHREILYRFMLHSSSGSNVQ